MLHRRLFGLVLAATSAAAQGLPWDVPLRGAVTYERTTTQFSIEPAPGAMRLQWVVDSCEAGGHEWRYFSCPRGREPKDYEQLAFDDSGWLRGRGEFAPKDGKQPNVRTNWANEVILLRSVVDLGKKKPKALVLRIHHDDGVRVFVNGAQVLDDKGYGRDRYYVVAGDAMATVQAGENTIAVRGENIGGAQYLDVAVAVVATLPPGAKTPLDVQREFSDLQKTAARVRGDLFGPFRPPALLLHGELDRAAMRPVTPPGDLREVPFWIACDLGRGVLGGSYEASVPRMWRLGDLQLRGKFSPVDAEGWQPFDVEVQTTPEPAPGADSKRFVSMFVRPHAVYGFDGRIRGRRKLQLTGDKVSGERAGGERVSGDRARVAAVEYTFGGRFLQGKEKKDHAADLVLRESFGLGAVRENQDAVFRKSVREGIDRGCAFLKNKLANLKAPNLAREGDPADRSYHSGRMALALLALIKSGVAKDDPVIVATLTELRQRPLIDTYSLGNALMVLDAYYAPSHEFADQQSGRLERAQKRTLPADDLALMTKWTAALLENVDTRVDAAYMLRFNYVRDERYDHSVNQYGLLGLYSAHLCGVPVSAQNWEAAANHLIAAQCAPGASMQLDLTDFKSLARQQAEPEAQRTATLLPVKPAGWNYIEPKNGGENSPVWGSMTCAGITGLAICQAAIADLELKRYKLQNDIAAARNAAFGWLAQNLSVRSHPGSIEHQQHWFFYYLYGLERAALLSNVALIQGRDWYYEGAMVLLGVQSPDGSWPGEVLSEEDIERTAMAVLFLKRGTQPVLTGK